jgi:hypothetical protein
MPAAAGRGRWAGSDEVHAAAQERSSRGTTRPHGRGGLPWGQAVTAAYGHGARSRQGVGGPRRCDEAPPGTQPYSHSAVVALSARVPAVGGRAPCPAAAPRRRAHFFQTAAARKQRKPAKRHRSRSHCSAGSSGCDRWWGRWSCSSWCFQAAHGPTCTGQRGAGQADITDGALRGGGGSCCFGARSGWC